jgi:hypothetical protein
MAGIGCRASSPKATRHPSADRDRPPHPAHFLNLFAAGSYLLVLEDCNFQSYGAPPGIIQPGGVLFLGGAYPAGSIEITAGLEERS